MFTSVEGSCDFTNNYLVDIGRILHTQFYNDIIDDRYENVYNNVGFDNEIVFTCDDIRDIVNNIDVHKGSGMDYLPTFILKDCFEVLTQQLTYLFNQGAFH